MKQNLNEKIFKTNEPNAIKLNKVKINKKMNFKDIAKFNEGRIIYWCDDAIFGERKLLPKDWIKFKDETFVIVHNIIREGMNEVFICSFNMCGRGFFLETNDSSESLQVYKATEDRDYYYTVMESTNKKIQNTKTDKAVFNRKELFRFIPEYFDGIKSIFESGYDDSIVYIFSDFI